MTLEEKIKKLQARVGAKVDGDFGNESVDKVNAALDRLNPPAATPSHFRKITSIAVHCSATKEGQHFTAADIDKWHRAQGWAGIGYHAVVLLDGTIEKGRSEAIAGSHVAGHNSNSLAICYIGGTDVNGKPKDTRTPAQKASLLKKLKEWKAQHPNAVIQGHHDYPGVTKACPSFNAKQEYAGL
jgi:N-acetylmuramoyl-L-alanine amidase